MSGERGIETFICLFINKLFQHTLKQIIIGSEPENSKHLLPLLPSLQTWQRTHGRPGTGSYGGRIIKGALNWQQIKDMFKHNLYSLVISLLIFGTAKMKIKQFMLSFLFQPFIILIHFLFLPLDLLLHHQVKLIAEDHHQVILRQILQPLLKHILLKLLLVDGARINHNYGCMGSLHTRQCYFMITLSWWGILYEQEHLLLVLLYISCVESWCEGYGEVLIELTC